MPSEFVEGLAQTLNHVRSKSQWPAARCLAPRSEFSPSSVVSRAFTPSKLHFEKAAESDDAQQHDADQ